MKLFQMLALSAAVTTGLVMAQAPAAPAAAQMPAKEAKTAAKEMKDKAPVPAAPTAAQIADAKAKGMVWCNTNSKACHDSADKYFGTTKRGEFVAKSDLASKGYHMAGETGKSAAHKGMKKAATEVKK